MRLQPRRGAARPSCLACLAAVLVLVGSSSRGAVITLAPGVMNPPPSLASNVPEVAVADTARLVRSADFTAILAATLSAQGYTAANNWVYSFNSPPLPAGLSNPVTLAANADFHITKYELFLNPAMTRFGMTFDMTLKNPPADPVLAGATITRHWLQYVNTNAKVNNFGFAIAGQSGFWQVDNGQVVGMAGGANRGAVNGTGPYYDSNSGGGFSLPYDFHDAPQFYSGIGTYLHFTLIPAWDVAIGGKNYIVVGDTGITWGFAIVPEPTTITLLAVGIALALVAARIRRARGVTLAA